MIALLRDLWEWLTKADRVEDRWGCPTCKERRVDRLVWIEDGEAVRCEGCGTVYTP